MKQISRELRFGKLCESDYICRYYGVFDNKKSATINIAMEYCDGGSLEALYKKARLLGGRFGEKPLVRIAEHILTGLEYLEQHKIIHRDIKPSNILSSRDGNIKLCDFGVSGDSGLEGEAYTCIGTSYYMAPERMRGEKYTITSDVWSLGITLLEVAYNRFPFPDGKKLAFFDFFAFIASEAIELTDESENCVMWSPDFKLFINCWCVSHQIAYQ
jgi:mitogen-activated protein kinase kinase